jgi:hypothetical protein
VWQGFDWPTIQILLASLTIAIPIEAVNIAARCIEAVLVANVTFTLARKVVTVVQVSRTVAGGDLRAWGNRWSGNCRGLLLHYWGLGRKRFQGAGRLRQHFASIALTHNQDSEQGYDANKAGDDRIEKPILLSLAHR